MDDSARQLSLSLEAVAKAIAEWTVARHFEADESLRRRYGENWRQSWVTEVQTRLRYLAQAIALRRPKLFVETIAWSGSGFAARDVSVEDLTTSLRCLREVLEAELPEAAGNAAAEYVDSALRRLESPPAPAADRVGPGQPHGELTLRYLEAILSARRNDAVQLVVAALEAGLTVPEAYSHVLEPAQVEIGRMWHANEISVADEHYASATTDMAMSLMRPHFPTAPPRGRRVVATAVKGDLHALGLRMVADFLEMDGWESIYLGANTPHRDVIMTLVDREAHLLAASATSLLHVREVGDLVTAVRTSQELDAVKIVVGGAPFNMVPDLWEEVGADGWAPSAESAVDVANRLVGVTAAP